MRRTVQKILFLSALVLLGGVLAFQWTHSDTCLGLRFWEDIPDNCQYVYRDYSDVLWFYDQKAAVDVESSTVYISQDIGPETTYAALEGRLTLNNLLTPMYFLRDEAFQNLEAAVREGHRFGLIISTGRRYMRYDVVFTTLPVLAMEDPDSTMLTEKGPIVRGSLSLWSPVDTETDTYSVKHSLVRWKIRGQTTAELDKKCYKLTLEKNGGGKRNQNLLVVAPPPIGAGFHDAVMGDGCVEKSAGVAEQFRIICARQNVHFLDAKDCEFNQVDFMHLTCKGHAQLAEMLAKEVPALL